MVVSGDLRVCDQGIQELMFKDQRGRVFGDLVRGVLVDLRIGGFGDRGTSGFMDAGAWGVEGRVIPLVIRSQDLLVFQSLCSRSSDSRIWDWELLNWGSTVGFDCNIRSLSYYIFRSTGICL